MSDTKIILDSGQVMSFSEWAEGYKPPRSCPSCGNFDPSSFVDFGFADKAGDYLMCDECQTAFKIIRGDELENLVFGS